MKTEAPKPRSLREIEMAVEIEGREWTRRRLQAELQKEADLQGGVFPPQRKSPHPSAPAPDATAHRRRGG
jgi:hypothetical protein